MHSVGVFPQIASVFVASGSKEGEEKEEGLTAQLFPLQRIRITELIKPGGLVNVNDGLGTVGPSTRC